MEEIDQQTHPIEGDSYFENSMVGTQKKSNISLLIILFTIISVLTWVGILFFPKKEPEPANNEVTVEEISTQLTGKLIYSDRITNETLILDFDNNLEYKTGVDDYIGSEFIHEYSSPDKNKLLLPGKLINDFNSSPITTLRKKLLRSVQAMYQDPIADLFIINFSAKTRQQMDGNFVVGHIKNTFLWLDDETFCYREVYETSTEPYRAYKYWLYKINGVREEANEEMCRFEDTPENIFTSRYILNTDGNRGYYETTVKVPGTQEEFNLKPEDCDSVSGAELSPDGVKAKFNCESSLENNVYILTAEDLFKENYDNAVKINYNYDANIQWVDNNQLLLTTFIGDKTAGEMWNTSEISLVNVDGTKQVLVPEGTRITYGPIISPGQNAFLYETIEEDKTNRERDENEVIVVMSLNKEVLFRFLGTYAKWTF